MYPTTANGQPAAVTYRRDSVDHPYMPFGVAILTTDNSHITAITVLTEFADPGLVALFDVPAYPSRSAAARRPIGTRVERPPP